MARVSVDKDALDTLLAYAEEQRRAVRGDYETGRPGENDKSEAEIAAVAAGLDVRAIVSAGILEALREFWFGNYGCDDIDELMADEDLEIGPDLAAHIAGYLEA